MVRSHLVRTNLIEIKTGATVSRSYVTLAEYPSDMVRLACTKCERRGQYRKTKLLERARGRIAGCGRDLDMITLKWKVSRKSRCVVRVAACEAFRASACRS